MNLKELQDKLDLTLKHSGYFNKNIFRATLFILLLVLVYGLYLEDWQLGNYYITCPEDAIGGRCINPMYVCQEGDVMEGTPCTMQTDNFMVELACANGDCQKKYIPAGESIGKERNHVLQFYSLIVFFALACAFSLNHLLYVLKFRESVRNR